MPKEGMGVYYFYFKNDYLFLWWPKLFGYHKRRFSNMTCPPFLVIENIPSMLNNGSFSYTHRIVLVAIWHTFTIRWWLKILNHRKGCMHVLSFWKNNQCFPFWATKFFFNLYKVWWLKFLNHQTLRWLKFFRHHTLWWMKQISVNIRYNN